MSRCRRSTPPGGSSARPRPSRSRASAERYARATYPRRGTAMAVGIRLKFPGGTQEQYEAVHGHMNIDTDPPEGLIFHSAGPIDEGWGVIDFWESSEAFDRFAQGRL